MYRMCEVVFPYNCFPEGVTGCQNRLAASIGKLMIDFIVGRPLDETVVLFLAEAVHYIYLPLTFPEGIDHQTMSERCGRPRYEGNGHGRCEFQDVKSNT